MHPSEMLQKMFEKYKQPQLAKDLGCAQGTVSKVMRGVQEPTYKLGMKIVARYNEFLLEQDDQESTAA